MKAVRVTVPLGWGHAGSDTLPAQIVAASAHFPRRVTQAAVALSGFHNQYSAGAQDDHNVHEHHVRLTDVKITDDLVHFNVRLAIRESDGTDSFSGYVVAVVMAEMDAPAH
jgi:hypothetical protein